MRRFEESLAHDCERRRVHIRRLRVKLSAGPVPAPAIVAVRGFGYKMAVEDTANGAAA